MELAPSKLLTLLIEGDAPIGAYTFFAEAVLLLWLARIELWRIERTLEGSIGSNYGFESFPSIWRM